MATDLSHDVLICHDMLILTGSYCADLDSYYVKVSISILTHIMSNSAHHVKVSTSCARLVLSWCAAGQVK